MLSRAEKKTLAYPIQKNQEAFYLSLDFSLPSENLEKVYNQLNSEKNILRYLITIKQETKPQPVRKPIDFKIVDKIEPLKETPFKEIPREKPREIKEKVKIEELDKKLEEILR